MIRLDEEDKQIAYNSWQSKPTEEQRRELIQAQIDARAAIIKMQDIELRLLRDEVRYLRGYVAALGGDGLVLI